MSGKKKASKPIKRRRAMGDVKSNMKPSTDKVTDLTKKDEGIFGRLIKRKGRDTPGRARTFADCIEEADTTLQKLIATKAAELNTEHGEEAYNQKALAHLRSMEWHLEQVCNLAADYAELKH